MSPNIRVGTPLENGRMSMIGESESPPSRHSSSQSLSTLDTTIFPAWITDESVAICPSCDVLFSILKRKHHCRTCGGVFCQSCSSFRIPFPSISSSSPPFSIRVCRACNDALHNETSDLSARWHLFSDEVRLKAGKVNRLQLHMSHTAVFPTDRTPPGSVRVSWQSLEYDNTARVSMGKGTLYIDLEAGEDLPIADQAVLGAGGSSDPYVVLKVGGQTVTSSVVNQNLNPIWGEQHVIENVPRSAKFIHVSVYDKDLIGSEFMAGVSIPLHVLSDGERHLDWWVLTTDADFLKVAHKARLSTSNIAANKSAIVSPQVKTPSAVKGRLLLGLRWESHKTALDSSTFSTSRLYSSLSRLNYHLKHWRTFQRHYASLQRWDNAALSLAVLITWMTLCMHTWAFPLALHLMVLTSIFWSYVRYRYSQSPSLALILADDDEDGSDEEGLAIHKPIVHEIRHVDLGVETQGYLNQILGVVDAYLCFLERIEEIYRWKNPEKSATWTIFIILSAVVHFFIPFKYSLIGILVSSVLKQAPWVSRMKV